MSEAQKLVEDLLEESRYAWLITKDLGDWKIQGLSGPRSAPSELIDKLKAGEGQKFRVKDDDEVVYYEGLYLGSDDDSLFGPLDDYGTPSLGATTIEYFMNGKWTVI